jgi:recombination protein RecA
MGAARINLEALLRARKLDNTLTSALPAPDVLLEQNVVPTGVAVLDERLHGGVPRGQVSEIVGPRSSGRAGLLVAMLAGATGRGEMAALVDPLDMFDAASAAAGGVDLGRLLWVRGQWPVARGQRSVAGGQRDTRDLLATDHRPLATASREEAAVDRAVKALNLVLQAGGFGLVALDLAEVPPPVVRRLPFTTWLRLQRVIEGSETVCVLLAADPVARSAGGVTIALRHSNQGPGARDQGLTAGGQWSGASGQGAAGGQRRARLFLGFDTEVRLNRARWPETTPCQIRFGSPVTCSP